MDILLNYKYVLWNEVSACTAKSTVKKLQLVVSKNATGRGNSGHSSINKHYIA